MTDDEEDPPEDPTDVLLDDDDVVVGGSAGSSATNPRPPRGAGIGGRIGDEEGSDATDELGLWDGGGGTWALRSSPRF